MKYHLNVNGDPAICKADKKKCPRGGITGKENHFNSLEEAQRFSEKENENNHGKMNTMTRKTALPKLSEHINLKLLNKMVAEGYVNVSSHPDDNSLKLLNYSRSAQYEGKWNDATKMTRGLMIKASKDDYSDAVIIERPWKKFFTLSQIRNDDGSAGWALGDEEENESSEPTEMDRLDFTAPAIVTDKLDGSMGILYTAPNGELAISTKGSFVSEQAIMYTKLLKENKEMYEAASELRKNNPDTTFIFELVGRENQIVVAYDKNDISLIGAVDKSDGRYHSVLEYSDVWNNDKGLSTTEIMPAENLQEALSLPPRENREGVVVMILSDDLDKQMQLKIKQDDYLAIHKLLYSMNKKSLFELTRNGKYAETMKNIPEGARRLHDSTHEKLLESYNSRLSEAFDVYEQYKHLETKKDFALAIKDLPQDIKTILFSMNNGGNYRDAVWNLVWKKDLNNFDYVDGNGE